MTSSNIESNDARSPARDALRSARRSSTRRPSAGLGWLAAVGAAAGLGLAGCGHQQGAHSAAAGPPKAPPPLPVVTVRHPVKRDVVENRSFTGRLEAVETADVRARVRGVLSKPKFQEGAEVEAGDVLYEIDPREYQAAVDEAKAEVARLGNELRRTESEAARAVALRQKKAISEEEYITQTSGRDSAEAMLQKAQASLRMAELNLGYTKVRAPIAGRIGRTMVTEGNLVGYNEPTLLATIIRMDVVYVSFEVPERDLLRYETLAREDSSMHDWTAGKIPVYVGLEGEEGWPHAGFINFRDNHVDHETGTVMLRALLKNPDRQLIPGLFARVKMPFGGAKTQLLVPEVALSADQRGRFVLVVKPDGTVDPKTVKIGLNSDLNGMLIVYSGIDADDQVVVNGMQRARPGTKVSPKLHEEPKERPSMAGEADAGADKDKKSGPVVASQGEAKSGGRAVQ